jgi:PAS domain S-box-containing protein
MFPHRLANGEVRTVEVHSSPIEQNGAILLFSIIHDIAEWKQSAGKNLRLAAIVESSDDAIIGKTLDGTIKSWNKGAETLYGYSAEEVIGQPISLLVPPEQFDDLPDILTRISRGEVVRHFETKRRTKDGRIVDVSLTVSPIKTPEGKIIGASSTARDITERKLLEKERQKVFVELQKALSEVKQLSGFLPICASCKKIRDDKGYWNEVERYISEHSEAQFSHGICPDCIRKLYPEIADEMFGHSEKDEKK